jgi:hypothetical protein
MRNWYFLLALSFASGAQAAPPQRVEIVYEVSHNGTVVAEVTDRLEHDGRSYSLQETWKGRGILALRGEAQRTSRGVVARDGLRPAEYRDMRGGRERRHATLDPGNGAATLEQQDRLSFIWNFAFSPPTTPVSVSVADGSGIVKYTYRPAGRERITSAAGEFETLKLVRQTDGTGSRTDEIWLAVDRQYLPVRIRVTEKDGTRIDQIAVRIASP